MGFETALAWREGDYHTLAVFAYTKVIDKIPWAVWIDLIQSMIILVFPNLENHAVFKYLRILNPTQLNKITADTVGVLIHSAVIWKIDIRRFERLILRMRKSGAGVLVDRGDKLGDYLCCMFQMDDAEFDETLIKWEAD